MENIKLTKINAMNFNNIYRAVRVVMLVLFASIFSVQSIAAENTVRQISVQKDHSEILKTQSPIVTVALGNPKIADSLLVSPHRILINGLKAGATSLTLILENGKVSRYQVLVTQDLSILRQYLSELDANIHLIGDPNGDSVILMGTVPNTKIIDRAVEATIRFLGTSDLSLSTADVYGNTTTTVRSSRNAHGEADAAMDIATNGSQTTGQSSENESSFGTRATQYETQRAHTPKGFTETIKSGSTRVVNLLIAADALEPGGLRLSRLLKSVDERIEVKDINGIYYLDGNVKSPAALVRALTLANSFAGAGSLNYEVISDQGGVLLKTGNASGSSRRRSSSRQENSSSNIERYTDLQVRQLNNRRLPVRGNIKQNIARGDVISVASGLVISLIHVDVVPRVEVKMRVVAIDRNKTDKMGINWQILNNRFSLSNFTGSLVNDFDVGNGTYSLGEGNIGFATNIGSSNILTTIQALETKGAARTLSEPLVTVLSGETANYLVGGEVPIASGITERSFGSNNERDSIVSYEYRDFGIILNLRPTVLENGRIAISLDQNISSPDFNSGAIVGGVPLPSFNTRSVQTFTEAGNGETWVVAGLLSYEDRKNVQGVPWLSDIPILGELFKFSSKNHKREELVITVTARTVSDLDSYAGAAEFPESGKSGSVSPDDLINSQFDFSGSLLLPSSAGASQTSRLFSKIDGSVHSENPSVHMPDQQNEKSSSIWSIFSGSSDSSQHQRKRRPNRPFGL